MRVFVAGWLMVVVAGCARVIGADFDEARPRVSAVCAPTRPFGAPRRLPLNDQLPAAWAPRLIGDQLTLYFTSADDEFVATRATLDEEFSNPVPF